MTGSDSLPSINEPDRTVFWLTFVASSGLVSADVLAARRTGFFRLRLRRVVRFSVRTEFGWWRRNTSAETFALLYRIWFLTNVLTT